MKDLNANTTALAAGEKLLSIEVTTHCNLHCLHCFVYSRKTGPASISHALVLKILREGYDGGYRRLHLTGGEPLLWEGLLGTLDDAMSLGYSSILINTNGTLLSKNMCARLSNCDKVSISVSLDGSAKYHDRLRGYGQYEKAMWGIENALDAGIGTMIFTAIGKSLLPKLPVFATGVFEKFPAIRCVCVIPLMNTLDGDFSLSDDLLRPKDFICLIWGISLLSFLGIRIDVLNEPLAYAAAAALECPLSQWSQPLNRKESIIVMADGTVRMSHFSRTDFGLYRAGRLQNILTSYAYQKAVTGDDTTCPLCQYRPLCTAHGMYRPSEFAKYSIEKSLYCRTVLDMISQQGSCQNNNIALRGR